MKRISEKDILEIPIPNSSFFFNCTAEDLRTFRKNHELNIANKQLQANRDAVKASREKIAEELFFQDWDSETEFATYNATNGNWAEQTDEHFREHYYKRADQIIKTILGEVEE